MCDKCNKYILKLYKICPKCSDDLQILDRENHEGIIFSPLEYDVCKIWLMEYFKINEFEFDILWCKYLSENIVNGKPLFEFLKLNDLLFIVNKSSVNKKILINDDSRISRIVKDIKNIKNPFDILSDNQKFYYLFHRQKILEEVIKEQQDIINDLIN